MINFSYQNRVTAQMPCGQTGCNINCFDDFEDFTPETGGYYMQQNIVPPILVTAPSLSGNTVDIWENGNNANDNLLTFHFIQTNGNQEFVIMPLSEPILPGCTAHFSMQSAAFSATPLTDVPTLGFYGMNAYPTCSVINFPSCANASFNVCGNITGYCMAISHLLIFGHFNNPNASNPITRYFIDNFSVTTDCHPQVEITPTLPSQQCVNGQVQISYNVCRASFEDEAIPFTLHASETWGALSLVLPSGSFDQNGDASLSIPANTGGVPVCTTLTLTAAVAANMPPCTEPMVNLNAQAGDPCFTITQTGGPATLHVEDCTQPAPCLCPPGSNSYTIGYAPCSVSYLDEANLPASLTGACLSVEGKLHINTPSFTMTNCNIILNDDAEIIVESGSKLTLAGTSTVVQGCNHLWNSITVKNGGSLDVQDAHIYDGKYAVTTENGAAILVRNNTFDKDYVGIYVPHSFSMQTIDIQQDIMNNTFDCSGPLIETFSSSSNTYAGICINSVTGFNVGLTGANYFKNIQNGMLANGSSFTIKNASINDLGGNVTAGYVTGQVGVGAMRCSGATIERCTMTNVRSGISAVSTNVTAKNNRLTGY